MESEELYNYVLFILSVYDKSWNNVTAVVGDNLNVNKSLDSLLDCGFVGCSSQRFDLAVCDIINKEITLFENVSTIMKNFKYLVNTTKLRKYTKLKAIMKSEKRWFSIFELIWRYFELVEFFNLIAEDDDESNELCLSDNESFQLKICEQ